MANEINKRINEITLKLSDDELAKQGFNFFKRKTPLKSGNARSKTILNGNTIQANYPYARRLDDGYSKKAPDGMTQPTIDHVTKYIEKT